MMRLLDTLLLPLLLVACAQPRDQVVLLDVTDPGGQITVHTPQQALTLATAYQTAQALSSGSLEVRHHHGGGRAAAVRRACSSLLPAQGRVWTLRFDTGAVDLTPESQAEVPALLAAIAGRARWRWRLPDTRTRPARTPTTMRCRWPGPRRCGRCSWRRGMQATFVRVVGQGQSGAARRQARAGGGSEPAG